ncbi:hypothetical protein ACO2WT_10100, partial [Ligilactobacillus salivarius]|uniref:hypothetical protein n=1 Tax=Ligilactobacillus salivarius TaxID=1624 RepID=UPI003BFABC11
FSLSFYSKEHFLCLLCVGDLEWFLCHRELLLLSLGDLHFCVLLRNYPVQFDETHSMDLKPPSRLLGREL